jgi:hypothetical protein
MRFSFVHSAAVMAALAFTSVAFAQGSPPVQPPAASEPKPGEPPTAETKPAEAAPEPLSMESLSWLAGCWRGTANQREVREHWLPLRGNLLVGAGHTVTAGRTQNFEYMRVEPRADGIYYVAVPSGQRETAFRLASREADGPDTIFTFTNAANPFPQAILYRRATGGWLYVHVEGKVGGEDRRVIYPLRRVDCEGGEFIER